MFNALVGFARKKISLNTLFILFINDISSICSGDVNHQLFADDPILYTTVSSKHDIFSLQTSLNNLQHWCASWQLEVNISKCYVLHLGKNNFRYSYTFSGQNIPTTNVVVDLGIMTQDNFRFDLHINSIISKALSRVGVLFRGFCTRSPIYLKKPSSLMFALCLSTPVVFGIHIH